MNTQDFTGRTVDDALTEATIKLGVSSDRLDYEVIEKGSAGILGFGSRNAVIRVSIKEEPAPSDVSSTSTDDVNKEVDNSVDSDVNNYNNNNYNNNNDNSNSDSSNSSDFVDDSSSNVGSVDNVGNRSSYGKSRRESRSESSSKAEITEKDIEDAKKYSIEFLSSVFEAMDLDVTLTTDYEEENHMLLVDMEGPEMGIIIGKRGQTLDSLQYLTNLSVNRKLNVYIRIKIDTEDYRSRRKATLENLAHNVGRKVKQTRHSVSLEPMNPYERRIIHYALQHDSYVTTYSEGDEPFRHVVVALKNR